MYIGLKSCNFAKLIVIVFKVIPFPKKKIYIYTLAGLRTEVDLFFPFQSECFLCNSVL